MDARGARSPARSREMRSDMGRKRYGTLEYYQCPVGFLRGLRGVGHVRELAGREGLDRLGCLGERIGLGRVAHREAFGVDEFHVVDAEEAQEIAYVTRLRIERRARVQPASGGEDISLLALEQALRALLAVAERFALARDVVKISLERRR